MPKNVTIDNVKIKNFGCVKDLDLKLTPIHALIGPNDSGKSTILRAVRTAMHLYLGKFIGNLTSAKSCKPFHPGLFNNAEIDLIISNNNYKIKFYSFDSIRQENDNHSFNRKIWDDVPDYILDSYFDKNIKNIFYFNPRMVRLDPDSLRESGGLIPSSKKIDLLDEKGIGLASIYDALMIKNIDNFISIRKQVCDLFPSITNVGFKNIDKGEKTLEIELKDGTRVPSQFMSEGILYYLAFAALQYLEPASIILVEEPENGLHPSRIKEIMQILRKISETTQVLIATHSPLVINELKDDEVSIVWRDNENGTKAMPVKETKNFAERSKIYALGELWLSYADGDTEKPLREGSDE
ncbi:MAG TPA: hypothetical protein DCO75_08445 [Fibrobacteres bacterium]|nr:hypothetical protein [Fibrobacterota bacterium]